MVVNTMINNPIVLFDHNEIGYQKLTWSLLKSKIASINHATGTGKSFIILKYLYDNRDKRILYLSPTYQIFTQLVEINMRKIGISITDFKKLDNLIYMGLLDKNIEELLQEYDIIVLDEYHRCGAKEWSKKIIPMMGMVSKHYLDKKIIGLTATPIRYLNDERNMNIELFDGACASSLDFCDAILKGILPAPNYIIPDQSCKTEIRAIKEFVNKKIPYDEEREKVLHTLSKLENLADVEVESDEYFKKFTKENGRYLVFNQTINSIAKNKKEVAELFPNREINFYEIHSRNTLEQNEEILRKFRNKSDGINILCVVDILNEGIHVDGIDGIIMLRETSSPIIYFQQVGRLLSFSGRNDELVIYDMKSNIKRHRAIYSLYNELFNRANELIVSDPENADRYKLILERFKMVNKTVKIMNELDEIKSYLSEENIIMMRLNKALDVLATADKNSLDRIQAHIDIFKYTTFFTEEMFIKLKQLNIIKPNELNISLEQFRVNLGGYKSIHEKMKNLNVDLVNKFEMFFKSNGRVPSILNENSDEAQLAKEVAEKKEHFSSELRKKVDNLLTMDISLSAYDRVFYGKRIRPSMVDEFSKALNVHYTNPSMLNANILSFLKSNQERGDFKFLYYLNRINIPNQNRKNNKISNLNERITGFIKRTGGHLPTYDTENEDEKRLYLEFMSQSIGVQNKYKRMADNFKYGLEYLETDEEKKDAVEKYVDELVSFININGRFPEKHLESEMEAYKKFLSYKKLLSQFGYMDKLNQLVSLAKKELFEIEKKKFVNELVIFIRTNYGDLPTMLVNDRNEIRLAKLYKKFRSYFTDEEKMIIDSEIIKVKEGLTDDIVELYIKFILNKKRYPMRDSDDNEEVMLVNRYIRNQDKLSSEDKARIKRIYNQISQKEALRNTYIEMLRRKK